MDGLVPAYPAKSIWSLRRTRQDPVAFLRRLAAEGDVVRFSLGGHPAFLLNHPDHVEDVLVLHHSNFPKPCAFQRSRALFGTGLLTVEGELHRRRRRELQPAFSPHRLERFGTTIAECAGRVRDQWREGQIVDLAAELHGLTMTIIVKVLFGADLAEQAADIRHALAAASASIDPLLSLLAPARRLRPARDFLRAVVDRLIDRRLASADDGDDLLTLWRHAEGSGQAGVTDQLRDDMFTLFVAGHDTIANGLTWTWHLLARHSEAERKLRDELRSRLGGQPPRFEHLKDLIYTGWVLAESLRLYPPSWVMTRRALNDHKVGGTVIPAGAIVVVSQYLLHRDARFFPNAHAFDPARWGSAERLARPGLAYFPFGAGPRSCIGQALATMEGTLLLASIAQRWRLKPLAAIHCEPRATLRPRGPVPMRLERIA